MKKFLWTLLIILVILWGWFAYLYLNPTSGPVVIVSSMPKADILTEDIATFHELFKINNLIEDSRLVLVSIIDDGVGVSPVIILKFKQQLNGIGVQWGNNYSFDKNTKKLRRVIGGTGLVSKDINTNPKISASGAVRIANSKSKYKALYKQAELFIREERKTIEDGNNYIKKISWSLAWKITPLNAEFPQVLIDADTGRIYYQWNGVYD